MADKIKSLAPIRKIKKINNNLLHEDIHYFGQESSYLELRDASLIQKGENMEYENGTHKRGYTALYSRVCAKNKISAKNKIVPNVVPKLYKK